MTSQQSEDVNVSFATPSTNAASGTYNTSKKRNHPFFISGLYDVFAQASSFVCHLPLSALILPPSQIENDGMNTYSTREAQTTIVTSGFDNNAVVEYAILASAYGPADITLRVDGVYYLSGRLIALNRPGIQAYYYNSDHRVISTTSNALEGELTNNTTAVGLGIILSRDTIPQAENKVIVVSVVLHTDYNPAVSFLGIIFII